MRRFLPPILAILALVPCGFAIVDVNNNGLSDYWERQYNNGSLFSASFDPQSDDDGDGWSNAKEAVTGTDPLDGTPPDGLLTPVATHHPSVWVDTDDDGIADTQTIETAEVKWPSLIGKQYQLYGSADLMPETWLEVDEPRMGTDGEIGLIIPLAQPDGSVPEHLFWRVAVRDVDTDGDGLTNHEEHQFGTNSNIPMTFPGIPDAWLAANFPSAQGFDPDDDPDGDGITNARENQLGLDPNSHNPTGLANPRFNEEITDEPTLSFRVEYPSDLYEQGSVEGWRADIGGHIEIWDNDDENPYVELQSHLGAHGVKQEFEMLPGSRMTFILRYKGRYEYEAYDNAFKLEVECAEEMLINGNPATVSGDVRRHSLMDDDAWDPGMVNGVWQENQKYGEWHYASVAITAPPGTSGLKELTLTLTPLTTTTYNEDSEEEDITYGGFVDLIPVSMEDNLFATGVDAVSTTADPEDIGYMNKFWIMAPSGNDPGGNPCSNPMKFRISANPSIELEMTYPQGEQAPATATPGTVTLGTEGADCAWHGESPTTTEDPPVVWKMGASGQPKTVVDLPIRVKTMKRRAVKVALHQIVSVVPGQPDNPPDHMPTKAQLEEKLNRVYACQINAWFDVSVLPAEPVAFDIADANTYPYRSFVPGTAPVPGDGVLSFFTWEQPEVTIATAHRPAGYDIHVYVLGGASPIQTFSSNEDPFILSPHEQQIGRANVTAGNYCIIDGDRSSNIIPQRHRTPEDVLHSIAHEVGHIIVGEGHPDEEGGDAPLTGTNRTRRLMCSGPNWTENSLLLVKKEWDNAETWLSARPNGDN